MNRLKKYFTEKPEGNIWKRATIYLILLRYISPLSLFFLIPMLAGMLTPNQDMDFTEISTSLAESFVGIMERLYDVGSGIAQSNPIISKVMVFGITNLIWVFYAGVLYLLIDISRHITSWVYNKRRKTEKK